LSPRAGFSTFGRQRPASALINKRRELALTQHNGSKRGYAVAAEDTDKGVVSNETSKDAITCRYLI